MIHNRKKIQHGDVMVRADGLLGRLQVNDETKECEIQSVTDEAGRWVVRVSSIAELQRNERWRLYPGNKLS
ncbi:hypothetical protein ANABIO32_25330 [Rossellomorea marisflavi]|uniref:hypothetical protein n=1 Tax=Rossellomorea marisflavi TaxID=189381 RepID=UPI0025CA90A2|nr:hypothetical protein [Rossellomorea marisflavi]GLI84816.1 hypothetical protein ANABIO32_25330 [Rossellomorea marisflavi]